MAGLERFGCVSPCSVYGQLGIEALVLPWVATLVERSAKAQGHMSKSKIKYSNGVTSGNLLKASQQIDSLLASCCRTQSTSQRQDPALREFWEILDFYWGNDGAGRQPGDGAAGADGSGGFDDDDDDEPDEGDHGVLVTAPASAAAGANPEPMEEVPAPEILEPTLESQVVEEIQDSQVIEEDNTYPEADAFPEVPATQPEPESPAAIAAAKAEPMTSVAPSAGSLHSRVDLTDANGTKDELQKKREKILQIKSGVLKLSMVTTV